MKTILDISNIVYSGHYGSPNFRISGFPLGGIRKVFGIINAELAISDIILCFDGGCEFKKELAPEYKAGRVPNFSVTAQIDFLKELLIDCNIPFMFRDGYEADDLICSSINLFDKIGDRDSVVIYSDDRDLACCVSSNTSIRNVSSNGICINKDNYEERVVKGEKVPYNSILLHKIFHGDKSDNYTGLRIPGLRFIDFADQYLETLKPYIESGSLPESSFFDLDVAKAVLESITCVTEQDIKEKIVAQMSIVFPRLFDVTYNGIDALCRDAERTNEPLYAVERRHIEVFGNNDFNTRRFDLYCSILGLNKCRSNRYGENFMENSEKFKERLRLRAKELSSGAVAVEKYRRNSTPVKQVTTIENMELPL